jgi:glycerophosphoryl diester phosphodiesterase
LIELRRSDGRVVSVGHRGAAALERENTLESFRRAIDLGVDFVEFDVLDLADGTLVVAHSDDLFEASHGAAAGSVRGLSLEELQRVVPDLPTLDEALDFFAGETVGLHVDLKCRRHGDAVARALTRHGVAERSVASAFWPSTLAAVRAEEPGLAIALTYPEDRHGLARKRVLAPFILPAVLLLGRTLPRRLPRRLRRAQVQVAMLHYVVVSAAAVDRCHDAGVAVWTWTVNSSDVLERVLADGVDGVISDDPRLLGATLTP